MVIFLIFARAAEKSQDNQAQKIKVRITKAEATDVAFHIHVEVSNISAHPLNVWDLDAVPGRDSAVFIFPDSMGGVVRVFRKENQQDHSGPPKMTTIPPKSTKSWDFNLFDRTWNIPEFIGSGTTDLVRLEVSAPATEAALRNEVWAGTALSETLRMNKTVAQIWPAQAIPFTSKFTK